MWPVQLTGVNQLERTTVGPKKFMHYSSASRAAHSPVGHDDVEVKLSRLLNESSANSWREDVKCSGVQEMYSKSQTVYEKKRQ